MNFGKAIEAMKGGHAVARSGWNGKNMLIYLIPGSYDPSVLGEKPEHIDGIDESLFNFGDAGTVTRLPNINMKSATGSTVTGWLASQSDMLAEDWEIVEAD